MRIFTLIALPLAIIFAVLTQGSHFTQPLAVFFVLALGVFGIYLVISALLNLSLHREMPAIVVSASKVWLVLALSAFLAFFGGWGISQYRIHQIRTYVEKTVPILDSWKAEKGQYPQDLPTQVVGNPPSLRNSELDYDSDGSTFSFSYSDPISSLSGYEFDSTERQWEKFD